MVGTTSPTYLTPRILPPNRQPHRVPPSPVRPRIPQPLDILEYLPSQIVLDPHVRQSASEVEDLPGAQFVDCGCLVDVEAGEHAFGGVVADAKERF